ENALPPPGRLRQPLPDRQPFRQPLRAAPRRLHCAPRQSHKPVARAGCRTVVREAKHPGHSDSLACRERWLHRDHPSLVARALRRHGPVHAARAGCWSAGMIDVLHVISGLGTGGAETMLVQLAGALRNRGVSQHVVSLSAHDALATDLRDTGIEVTLCGVRSAIGVPRAMTTVVRVVRRHRPRILQGWMYHGNLAASLGHNLTRGKRGRRLFWNLRASN